MPEFPLIKIEIEQMRHAIIHHFNTYQKDVSEAVEKEIEKVIKNFDFESAVKTASEQILSQAIKDYFQYGDGFKLIQSALQEALDKAFGSSV